MSIHGEQMLLSVLSVGDQRTSQYRAVEVDGTLGVTSATAIGILQNKPNANEHASIAFLGHMKGVAGAAVSAGAALMVASGGFMVTRTGSGTPVGKAITAAGSGGAVEFIGNFANAVVA